MKKIALLAQKHRDAQVVRVTHRPLMLAAMLSALLGACSLMPDYERPAAPVPAHYPLASAGNETRPPPAWQQFFCDPGLQQLIAQALENNRDLKIAALNVQAARALYGIQRAERFPAIDAGASATRQRLPADLGPMGQKATVGQYGVNLGITAFELDFFGRVRSLEAQALAHYLASEEGQRAAQLSIISGVAHAWLAWRSDLALLQLGADTLASREQSRQLVQRLFDGGIAAELDLQQARTGVEMAQAQHIALQRQVEQDINALQLLLGSTFSAAQAGSGNIREAVFADFPAGMPSSLMQNRPDILAAEHRLKAANANIGAARAAFFPRIGLTLNAGTASGELSGLFDGGSGSWLFAPQISVPIFNAGRLANNLEYARLQKNVQIADYERAIQTAFREVADGLAARQTYASQLAAEQRAIDNARRSLELAELRYRQGIDSYLTVLDAQRTHYATQQQWLLSRRGQLASEVALYQALGGNWTQERQDGL